MYLRSVATLNLDTRAGFDSGDTMTSGELDLQKYFVNPGKREMKATLAAGITTTDSGTFSYKLQESNTTVDSDFSDISGAAFTNTVDSDTGALSVQQLHFFTSKRYVRGAGTIVGGTWFVAAAVFAVKRDA
jgi:hypothetical protein